MGVLEDVLDHIFLNHTPPIIGVLYSMAPDGNPFSSTLQCRVLAVKDGWVQYCYILDNGADGRWKNEAKISMFNRIYKKETDHV